MRAAGLLLALAFTLNASAAAYITLARPGAASVDGPPLIASNGNDFTIFWEWRGFIHMLSTSVRRRGAAQSFANVVAKGIRPAVAWNGSRFALVYATADGGIELAMIDAEDTVRWLPQLIDTAPGSVPQIAWDGHHFLVIYRRTTDGKDELWGQLFDGEGPGHWQSTIRLATKDVSRDVDFRIASNGNGFMITWSGQSVHALAVAPDGTPIRDTILAPSYPGFLVPIASDGRDYTIAWQDARGGLRTLVSVISADGSPRRSPQTLTKALVLAALQWTGTSYVVAAYEDDGLHMKHLSSDGNADDTDGVLVAARGRLPSIASTGGQVAMVFQDDVTGPARAVELLPNDTVAPLAGLPDDATASFGASDQDDVATAQNLFGTLVVWRETRAASRSLRFKYFPRPPFGWEPDGTPIHGDPFGHPAVATNGDVFLVAWLENDRVRAVRIDRNGGLIDFAPLELGPAVGVYAGKVTVAAIGKTFVVVLSHDGRLIAKRIAADDGRILDVRVVRPQIGGDRAEAPAAAWNGQTLMVAYSEFGVGRGVEAVLLDNDLHPKLARPIVLDDPYRVGSAPSIAWGGQTFLVTWPAYFDIRAAALDSDGRLLATTALLGNPPLSLDVVESASASWDGDAFHVAAEVIDKRVLSSPPSVVDLRVDALARVVARPIRIPITDYDAPAVVGPLLFYPARDAYGSYGAKRIVMDNRPLQ